MRAPLLFAILISSFGCQHEASAPPPSAPATVTTTTAAPSVTSAAPAPREAVLVWKAKARGTGPMVHVTLGVDDRDIDLGDVDATSDDETSGTIATCAIQDKTRQETSSRFGCGGTPAYHFFTATLRVREGAVVVTSTRGVDGEPGSESVKEVARVPTRATTLVVRPFSGRAKGR